MLSVMVKNHAFQPEHRCIQPQVRRCIQPSRDDGEIKCSFFKQLHCYCFMSICLQCNLTVVYVPSNSFLFNS